MVIIQKRYTSQIWIILEYVVGAMILNKFFTQSIHVTAARLSCPRYMQTQFRHYKKKQLHLIPIFILPSSQQKNVLEPVKLQLSFQLKHNLFARKTVLSRAPVERVWGLPSSPKLIPSPRKRSTQVQLIPNKNQNISKTNAERR